MTSLIANIEFCSLANQHSSPFILPALPIETTKIGFFSAQNFEYHHGKHHAAYVDNLNNLLSEEKFADMKQMSLEQIIVHSNDQNRSQTHRGIFNNAAQIWNHTFYWHSMSQIKTECSAELSDMINKCFGDCKNFNKEFKNAALGQFGSGWAWLAFDTESKELKIVKTSNAHTCFTEYGISYRPLLVCDVWEHAYYIDFKNKRGDYVDAFLNVVDWNVVSNRFAKLL